MSEWKFQKKGKIALPVWYDLDQRSLTNHGTRVRIHLKEKPFLLLQPEQVRDMFLRHYLPLITFHDFYGQVKLYDRITVLLNGDIVESGERVSGNSSRGWTVSQA